MSIRDALKARSYLVGYFFHLTWWNLLYCFLLYLYETREYEFLSPVIFCLFVGSAFFAWYKIYRSRFHLWCIFFPMFSFFNFLLTGRDSETVFILRIIFSELFSVLFLGMHHHFFTIELPDLQHRLAAQTGCPGH